MAKYVIVLDNTIVIFFDGDAGTMPEPVSILRMLPFSSAVFCSLSSRFDEQYVPQLQLLVRPLPLHHCILLPLNTCSKEWKPKLCYFEASDSNKLSADYCHVE